MTTDPCGEPGNTLGYYLEYAEEYVARTNAVDMSPVYGRFDPLLPKDAVILDLGCGGGRDARHFARCGHRVIAMDPCRPLLEQARRHAPQGLSRRIWYVVGAAPELPLRDCCCSAVWASASLLHLPRRALPLALSECRRVLAQGGICFITVKRGDGERIEEGRHFTYWRMDALVTAVANESLEVATSYETPSLDKRDIVWLHVVARRR